MLDADGRVLLVRKRGTAFFMQPGGKLKQGESDLESLVREIKEELGIEVDPSSAHFIGSFRAPAANEPGHFVDASLFRLRPKGLIRPQAEIEEIVWIDPKNPGSVRCAPFTLDFVLPIATNE